MKSYLIALTLLLAAGSNPSLASEELVPLNDDSFRMEGSYNRVCAQGGPVSEAFYENEYRRCQQVCQYGGACPNGWPVYLNGNLYTNGMYQIWCTCTQP